MPCNSIVTDTNSLSEPGEECNSDLAAQTQYLGSSNWLLYTNKERFNPEGYGDEAFNQYSTIINQ